MKKKEEKKKVRYDTGVRQVRLWCERHKKDLWCTDLHASLCELSSLRLFAQVRPRV